MRCQMFLRSSRQYTLIKHLPQLGTYLVTSTTLHTIRPCIFCFISYICAYALTWFGDCSGARPGKHWFLMKDVTTRVHKLLTITPRGHHLPFPPNKTSKHTLSDLFCLLKVSSYRRLHRSLMVTSGQRLIRGRGPRASTRTA